MWGILSLSDRSVSLINSVEALIDINFVETLKTFGLDNGFVCSFEFNSTLQVLEES